MSDITQEKPVYRADIVLFVQGIDKQWRVFFASNNNSDTYSIVLAYTDGLELLDFLDSGKEGDYTIEDETFDILVAPTKDNPVIWNPESPEIKLWRRKLAKPRASLSRNYLEG